MKKITLKVLSLTMILCALNSQAQSPPGSGWTKVFEDNFSGSSLNTTKWLARTDRAFKTNAIDVTNGKMIIKSAYTNSGKVSGGWVQSKEQFGGDEKYGYYEARIRINGQSNGDLWATWWLWGGNYRNGGPAPSATELDVMEYSGNAKRYFGNAATSSHHYFNQNTIDGKKNKTTTKTCAQQRNAFGWHTWGVLWTPTEISFFYDGNRYMISDQPEDAAIDNVPTRLIFSASPHGYLIPDYNVDAGGGQPNNPVLDKNNAAKKGRAIADFEVDWVRVWSGGVITDTSNSCNSSSSSPSPSSECNNTRQSGKGIDIGAYGSDVYLIGTNNFLYKSNGNGGWNLVNSSKQLKRLDVAANGDVWAIGQDNKLWQFQNNQWLDKNGTGKDVGVGKNDIYIIGMDNKVRKYTGNGTYSGPLGTGSGLRLDVSGNNIPWIRGTNNGLYQWVGNGWHRKGTLNIGDVGIEPDGGNVIVTGTNQNVYHYSGNGVFRQINGQAVTVTVNSNAIPWVINNSNNIYRRECEASKNLRIISDANNPLGILSIYPNPSQGQTSFDLHLEKAGQVSLSIFDINGKRIATITDKLMDKGRHSLTWYPENVAAGIYIAQLNTSTDSVTSRLVLGRR